MVVTPATGVSRKLSAIWDSNLLILNHICPASLHTITNLAVNTILHLEDDGDFSGSDSSDSVNGLSFSQFREDVTSASALAEIIPMLTSLQSLQLMVVLQGDFPVDTNRDHFLGPQWTRLSHTLATLCSTLDLRVVSILVHLRSLDYFSRETYLEDARELQRGFIQRVYPAQFGELEELRKGGLISFSLEVEVSVGDSVDEYAGHHSLLV